MNTPPIGATIRMRWPTLGVSIETGEISSMITISDAAAPTISPVTPSSDASSPSARRAAAMVPCRRSAAWPSGTSIGPIEYERRSSLRVTYSAALEHRQDRVHRCHVDPEATHEVGQGEPVLRVRRQEVQDVDGARHADRAGRAISGPRCSRVVQIPGTKAGRVDLVGLPACHQR